MTGSDLRLENSRLADKSENLPGRGCSRCVSKLSCGIQFQIRNLALKTPVYYAKVVYKMKEYKRKGTREDLDDFLDFERKVDPNFYNIRHARYDAL